MKLKNPNEDLTLSNVIIAVDISENNLNIPLFAIKLMEGIPTKFTLLYFLNNKNELAFYQSKMEKLIHNLKIKPAFTFGSTIDSEITLDTIEKVSENINLIENLCFVALGISKNPSNSVLGNFSKALFRSLVQNVITVPVDHSLKSVNKVDFLLEPTYKSRNFFSMFQDFLRFKNPFINLIYLTNSTFLDTNERELIRKYQLNFKNNQAFPTIYKTENLIEKLSEHLLSTTPDLFCISYTEDSQLVKYKIEVPFNEIPVCNFVPILFSKRTFSNQNQNLELEYFNN